ncbi:uncharacterized protein zgc:193711 [Alosa sapidissima]|uniref:uncharacterized protein zgc:193711 n=1 Tax=Alosa sapidissima TaxID=34773 RepID=UPI001C090755|nr:uncharacterized protein zgc:193711 [Alosa sapidissima]
MGNKVTRTFDKWGVDTKKLKLRSKKRKDAQSTPPEQTADVHLYDTVPDEPVYAKVNKKKRQPEEELHYAEIQVLQSGQMASRGRQRPPPVSSTEYASLDFSTTPHTKAPVSASASSSSREAADILIPPGALQRPKSKSHKKRGHCAEDLNAVFV